MNTLTCPVCRTAGFNRLLGPRELADFWGRKGVEGKAPPGYEVRAVIECMQRLDLPGRDVCGCRTAWVRNAADEAWRPIVVLPADFVAAVAGSRS